MGSSRSLGVGGGDVAAPPQSRAAASLPTGLAYQTGKDGLSEGSEVTVAFSPEVDPTKVQAEAFSLRWKGKDYLIRTR